MAFSHFLLEDERKYCQQQKGKYADNHERGMNSLTSTAECVELCLGERPKNLLWGSEYLGNVVTRMQKHEKIKV